MEEEKKETADYNYTLQWLHNGVVVTDLDENFSECRELPGNDKERFDGFTNFLGKFIGEDVHNFCRDGVHPKVRINVTVKELE